MQPAKLRLQQKCPLASGYITITKKPKMTEDNDTRTGSGILTGNEKYSSSQVGYLP